MAPFTRNFRLLGYEGAPTLQASRVNYCYCERAKVGQKSEKVGDVHLDFQVPDPFSARSRSVFFLGSLSFYLRPRFRGGRGEMSAMGRVRSAEGGRGLSAGKCPLRSNAAPSLVSGARGESPFKPSPSALARN